MAKLKPQKTGRSDLKKEGVTSVNLTREHFLKNLQIYEDTLARTEKAKLKMNRNRKMYDLIGRQYEVSSDRYLQRHSIHLQMLFTKAMIVLLTQSESGPTVQKWRNKGKSNQLVARYIVAAVYAKRKAVTAKELIAITGKLAGKTSVESCLRDGKSLKLLRVTKEGYLPTTLLVNELQDRLGEKLLNEDVQRFFRFAVMWSDQRKFAIDAMNDCGDLNFDGETQTTFLEQILNGRFDRDTGDLLHLV